MSRYPLVCKLKLLRALTVAAKPRRKADVLHNVERARALALDTSDKRTGRVYQTALSYSNTAVADIPCEPAQQWHPFSNLDELGCTKTACFSPNWTLGGDFRQKAVTSQVNGGNNR
jgi:hypothetical protein